MVRILLVGSGGREHSIADVLARSEGVELYSYMSSLNPGISNLSKEYVVGNVKELGAIEKWALSKKVELAVIGPEAPLEKGLADALTAKQVKVCGPTRNASRIEWDKAYARKLMQELNMRECARFVATNNLKEAAEFIDSLNGAVAVKPAGLTGGKGVKVVGSQLKDGEEAKAYAKEVLESSIGGLAEVVVEERLEGEEFTLQAFVDGTNVIGMPLVQDHKRAYEGDMGPNTGGMGSYSYPDHLLPFIQEADKEDALEAMRKVVRALASKEGAYNGILYGQFMAGKEGVKLIEFNARFGDPEAMNVLPLLKSDFAELAFGIAEGALGEKKAKFSSKATVCKYLVPEGYPSKPIKNQPVEVDVGAIKNAGARIFYASIDERDGKLYSLSSRTAAVVGIASEISEAEQAAENACSFVKGKLFHRRDIGTASLIERRIKHMKELRG
ncbi:phosphoribosylamine--glycine ligase [Candidatus Micrarchaeota archaeon]|nr:MAG: phosphoribosylamine--glycine ligase [Candidatus Micrarchaeota archaeon]